VKWPDPRPGLVIRYSYLWRRKAAAGREEGEKDRPCAVVLANRDEDGNLRVYALPITHTRPHAETDAVEIPAIVKHRLGLDDERCWIVITEANVFSWPGPDLRIVPGKGTGSVAYGFLPPKLFKVVRDRFLTHARRYRLHLVVRTE